MSTDRTKWNKSLMWHKYLWMWPNFYHQNILGPQTLGNIIWFPTDLWGHRIIENI